MGKGDGLRVGKIRSIKGGKGGKRWRVMDGGKGEGLRMG